MAKLQTTHRLWKPVTNTLKKLIDFITLIFRRNIYNINFYVFNSELSVTIDKCPWDFISDSYLEIPILASTNKPNYIVLPYTRNLGGRR